jgi:hypothetical protein
MLAMGCGGGESDAGNAVPVLKLEVLAGRASVDFDNCQSADGVAASAQFSHLLRTSVYRDAVFLVETGESCRNVSYAWPGFVPNQLQPAIRKLSGGVVETAIELNSYLTMGGSNPIMVRYPSGYHRHASSQASFVLGYAATSSDMGFVLDAVEVSRYNAQGGWNYYVPGLFKYTQAYAGYDDLVAGTPDKAPVQLDGKGQAAGFVAPHDLEVDAEGRMYLIDDGRIRTVDGDFQVKTLDHTALGITGAVKALDADHQGGIHALVQLGDGRYAWHRLIDGSQTTFTIQQFVNIEPLKFETFTVVGNEIVLGVRQRVGDTDTSLYRVSANGTVKVLTGTAAPAKPEDFLDQPSQYLLPQVQHVEYGVDGHLYIVLPQGVLIARNYK